MSTEEVITRGKKNSSKRISSSNENQLQEPSYILRRKSLRIVKAPKKFLEEILEQDDEKRRKRKLGKKAFFDKTLSASDNEDEDEDSNNGSWKRKINRKKKKKKKRTFIPKFNPNRVQSLAAEFPDSWFVEFESGNPIEYINADHTLSLKKTLTHPGAVYHMQLSTDYTMLATCSTLGSVRIWDISTWEMLFELRDEEEINIEEFFVVCWTENCHHIIAAGRLKNRKRWSEQDDDNEILPCPIKIFSLETGSVVCRLEGHTEEVLFLKRIKFKGDNYIVSSSEDGKVIKWKMDADESTLVEWEYIDDNSTSTAVSLSFVPDCGNSYFVFAADDGIKLVDFEAGKVVDSWTSIYSYLCDCVKFVDCKDIQATQPGEYFLLSKGVELLNENDSSEVLFPNKVILHKLTMPDHPKGVWSLEEVARFQHDEYHSNIWLLKLTSNGRYVAAPTTVGKVFIWNLKSLQLVSVIKKHSQEVRDIMFHPFKNWMFTCGDDSRINVFAQKDSEFVSEDDLEVDISDKEHDALFEHGNSNLNGNASDHSLFDVSTDQKNNVHSNHSGTEEKRSDWRRKNSKQTKTEHEGGLQVKEKKPRTKKEKSEESILQISSLKAASFTPTITTSSLPIKIDLTSLATPTIPLSSTSFPSKETAAVLTTTESTSMLLATSHSSKEKDESTN